MGGSHSREELLETSDEEEEDEEEQEGSYEDATGGGGGGGDSSSERRIKTPSSTDEVEARLKALKLKYSSTTNHPPNAVKLYLHVGGNTPQAKWVTAQKLTSYSFLKTHRIGQEDNDDEDEEDEEQEESGESWWVLKVGSKIRSKVGADLQLKTFAQQRRVDFVSRAVWAMKFFTDQDYSTFVAKFQDCMFENTHGVEATEENKLKVYGKDFMVWAKPEAADDSMWEDAEDSFSKSPASATPVRASQDLREEFEEAANGGIQSLALGALDNSFLVGDSGIQVVKNFAHGIHGKGAFVNFGQGFQNKDSSFCTPKKTLLMKAETNMLLMSPMGGGKLHSTGLHQLDIETGRVVTEWKFGKDGTDVTMRDITNDSKGAQLDPSGSTFLGLDDNRLCRWDMRDRNGIVQTLADSNTPVLNWAQGHQFSRGTNFQCFATTGDGSIVVGSLDGKIRLYSINSMRQAKTAFPGLGSPVTQVDVTYDGKWIVGTTDTYLIIICAVFTDKDGKAKTGFAGRMGNKIAAPRLLKLNPLDSHLAGVNNKFRNAQFSWVTENGKQERHIVATVGKFSVIWNFQQVKDGSHECYRNQQGLKSCYCYKIVLRDDSIVDSRFMHDKYAVTDSPEAPLDVEGAVAGEIRHCCQLYQYIQFKHKIICIYGCCQSGIFEHRLRGPLILADNQKTMAVCIGRSFPSQPCSLFNSESIDNKPLPGGRYLWLGTASAGAGVTTSPRSRRICVAAQQRPTWLPGLDPPPYLDGTLAGDFGFDPLGLAEDPESLKWYVQAELVHSRFAMLGVLGILVTDLLRVTGLSKIPVWFEAGAAKYDIANTETLFIVQLLLMGFAETKRYMDYVTPGSQAKEGSFFGLEASLEGLEPGYPGGPLLNPLGLAKDIKNAHDLKLKEIKNGRLAMVAMLGIFVQASVTHVGPIDNLVEHLSNPWHKTIIQTLSSSSS